ncbi:MAG: hypothetical protein ACLFXM_13645 [Acidimicrobiia bacterium]
MARDEVNAHSPRSGSAIDGPEGIRFSTRPKVVTTRWPDPATSGIDLGFPTASS